MAADLDMSVDSNDLAIKGYDPVAYFDNKGPVKGTSKFTATYKNAIYHFVSSEKRDQFSADPQAWKIEDGKLYLNLDKSVQKRWLENTQEFIQDADNNWSTIKTVEAYML